MLSAEFPVDSQARIVLTAIGSGAPTFTAIGAQTGLASASLDCALKLLVIKHAIAVDQPTSGRPRGRETRYRIADTYLAFWTRFIEPALALLDRGRSQQALENILRQWPDYRGRAIEPIVRDSVARLLPLYGADSHTVASFWTRDGRTEVDLVGIDGQGSKRRVSFIGSIKWRQRRSFPALMRPHLQPSCRSCPASMTERNSSPFRRLGLTCATSQSPSAPPNFCRRGHRDSTPRIDAPCRSAGANLRQRFTAAAEDELAGWGIGPRPRPECASAIQCERRLRQARVIVSNLCQVSALIYPATS